MTLAAAVADYVKARTEADAAPIWARLMQEGIVCARMQELLAACYAEGVAVDVALVMHAPDYVREQAARWAGLDVFRVLGLVERSEQAKEPEPIVVLGPWRQRSNGVWYRPHPGSDRWGAYMYEDGYQLRTADGVWLHSAKGDKDSADVEMRRRGWVLLDSIPMCPLGSLKPWQGDISGRRYRAYHHGSDVWAAVHVGEDGWWVATIPLRHRLDRPAAHGPQTGAEGERLAMAAAYALGFVEGT